MTEKEAVAYLRNTPLMRFEDGSGVHSGLGDAMRMAVKALERMMPKKPDRIEYKLERICEFRCPECGNIIRGDINYCSKCGQRIK